jgi:hypothetical protein
MAIPFIQIFPNGRHAFAEFERSPKIEALAHEFIERGGQYLIRRMSVEDIQLEAVVIDADDRPLELAKETAENSPAMFAAVDRLVRTSIRQLNVCNEQGSAP